MKYNSNRQVIGLVILSFLLLLLGCVVQFVPKIEENQELLVVQGLITDQNESYKVKVSRSSPVWTTNTPTPVSGCFVRIKDDLGNLYIFSEGEPGVYHSDSTRFRGGIGGTYTLTISAGEGPTTLTYESEQVKMGPVPPIDTITWAKSVVEEPVNNFGGINGCNIYLDTHDPENNCKFYRWDFDETWVLRLLFPVPNQTCWISARSNNILVASTASLGEDFIKHLPVTYISNITDRLQREYSIKVNQYSVSEDEYTYWKSYQNLTVQTGGLYDVVPSSVPGNMHSLDSPEEKVLGYFSVSAKKSKRIFIKDDFRGIIYRYGDCARDTVWGEGPIPGEGLLVWVLYDDPPTFGSLRRRILTDKRGCADCTVRGSNIKPSFWHD